MFPSVQFNSTSQPEPILQQKSIQDIIDGGILPFISFLNTRSDDLVSQMGACDECLLHDYLASFGHEVRVSRNSIDPVDENGDDEDDSYDFESDHWMYRLQEDLSNRSVRTLKIEAMQLAQYSEEE